VLLLVAAGLFLRALQSGLGVDPGFDPEGVLVATTNVEPHGYDEARGREFYRQLVERVQALPGVESVALARVILASGTGNANDVRALQPGQTDGQQSYAYHNWVTPAYFNTMRVPMIAGRALHDDDRAGAQDVVVINQTLARRLWPEQNPLGKRLRAFGKELEVVGVARDGKYMQMGEDPRPFLFHSFAQNYYGRMTLHVRTRGVDVLPQIREQVRALDPNVAVERAGPLPVVVGISLLPQRLGSALVGIFGLLGLLLAALGVYGVLAFQVAQRTREIGIRLALGATVRGVRILVLRQGTRLAVTGAALGLLVSAAATRYLRAFLFGVSPLDLATFLAVPVTLLVVALLASYIPARRATRVTPLEALRAE
jgi:predicted permease